MPMVHAEPVFTPFGIFIRVAFIAGLLGLVLYSEGPVFQRARTLGLFRDRGFTPNLHGLEGLKAIPDTLQCEDLHYYAPLNQVWGACQTGNPKSAHFDWFPPLQLFNENGTNVQGKFVHIDAFTHDPTVLKLENFDGNFMTHGFDILPTVKDDPAADIFLFAINHLPNQAHFNPAAGKSKQSKIAASQVELFVHTPGSGSARHVRSIAHPQITTPNDIFAVSPNEFYVTNDHYSTQSHALRSYEDLWVGPGRITSNVLHVSFTDAAAATRKPLAHEGVTIEKALTGEHNPNGLGHGHSLFPEEVTLNDAAGGVLTRTSRNIDPSATDKKLKVIARKQLDSGIDNPSFFEDPYPDVSGLDDGKGKDASGYIIAGLGRGVALAGDLKNLTLPIPSLTWYVPMNGDGVMGEAQMIWQDNGYTVRSISSSVLVAIPPTSNGGKKHGWLFTSGFVSDNVFVSKIDLSGLGTAPEPEVAPVVGDVGDEKDEL